MHAMEIHANTAESVVFWKKDDSAVNVQRAIKEQDVRSILMIVRNTNVKIMVHVSMAFNRIHAVVWPDSRANIVKRKYNFVEVILIHVQTVPNVLTITHIMHANAWPDSVESIVRRILMIVRITCVKMAEHALMASIHIIVNVQVNLQESSVKELQWLQ